MTEIHNHRHWTDDKRGVYEVWYLTWNHPGTDQGFWLRYITEAPVAGPPHAELWFARFDPRRPDKTFAIHNHVAASHLASSTQPFSLSIADSWLGHDHARGHLSGDGHDVRWDLRWDPSPDVLRHLPDVMYARGGLGETTVQSPNPRVAMTGSVVVDGEQLSFDRATLGQTHLWGKKHAYSWVWGRCAEFAGAPDALLEILGVRLQRRGLMVPPMFMLCLDLDGEHHRLNQFRHVTRNRATWNGQRVAFSAESLTVKVEGELTCAPSDMVAAPYVDPDGQDLWCMNTMIGDARITVHRRAGLRWREHRRLEGKRRAHFELGGRVRDPAVTREHILVP